MGDPLLINFGAELRDYLQQHPGEVPEGIDVSSLWVICNGLMIDDIERYTSVPYDSEFNWELRFNNSDEPEKVYHYKIHYRAFFQGGMGIVSARLLGQFI